MKNKTRFQPVRLKELAAHLMTTRFPTKKTVITEEMQAKDYGDYTEVKIPYFHYVVMEMPVIFSEEWSLDDAGNPIWKEDEIGSSISSMLQFFGITYEMFQHLLIPEMQNTKTFSGKMLDKNSTPHDIGYNILHLVHMLTES